MSRRIAILGAGAAGGYADAHMAAAGHGVTLVDAWPQHVDTMTAHGPARSGRRRSSGPSISPSSRSRRRPGRHRPGRRCSTVAPRCGGSASPWAARRRAPARQMLTRQVLLVGRGEIPPRPRGGWRRIAGK
nr:2-dehydropantoate 2-reductase N-terminal domain-containing protein [uncultured Rhodopila sp.]